MICNKCNHKLPEDSEFCQYCGIKIDKAVTTPVEAEIEAPKMVEPPVVVPVAPVAPVAHAVNAKPYVDDKPPEEASNIILKKQIQNTIQDNPSQKKEKTSNTKFCSRCGSMIDSKTKKCTGCGKQYFRRFRFTRFSVTVIVLALVIATVSTLCVLQYINTQDLEHEISYLERQNSTKQSTIDRLESEIDDLEDEKNKNRAKLLFHDLYTEVAGDDGTKVYHKYGCSKLNILNGFWIFNSEAAEGRGFKKCSLCH